MLDSILAFTFPNPELIIALHLKNFLFPQLGQAGLPYAKSVPSITGIQGARPDPGDLFDLLMGRDEDDPNKTTESGTQISSMLLYHATIIIHDIFRTNAFDKNISDTSSYLDLSPLYGRDEDHQWTIRTGRQGLLKPDSFAEDRLMNQPPGVCIYLIMYSRFHNYVAKQLLEINENGKFDLKKQATGKCDVEAVVDSRIDPHTGPSYKVVWAGGLHKESWLQPADLCCYDLVHHFHMEHPDKPKVEPYLFKSMMRRLKEASDPSAPKARRELTYQESVDAAQAALDEQLFQTARLITCGKLDVVHVAACPLTLH